MTTPAATPARPAPDDALGLIARARWRDPLGDRAQAALVAATMFMLPLGTAPLAIMSSIAMGYALLRLWATGPVIGYLIRLPIIWVLLATLVWTLVSLNESADRSQGWDEAAILRFQIPFLIALWPVVDRWRIYLWSLAAGVAVAAVVQVGQSTFGDSWPLFFWWHAERIPGRYPGLVHPNSTAVVAVAAILLLPRQFIEQRRHWLAGLVLWVLAWVGLVLTGSRGGWIAAMAGLVASVARMRLAWVGIRRTHERLRSWRTEWIVGGALLIIALTLAVTIGPQVASRVRSAASDLQAAIKHGDYSGDVAARWRQVDISFALAREHPLTGVGAGGYLDAARKYVTLHPVGTDPESSSADQSGRRSTGLLAHPHSALLYHLAVLGWPGLLLYLALWTLLALEARKAPLRGVPLNRLPLVAGLFVAFLVDSHNLSAPGALVLMFVVGIVFYETRQPSPWLPPGDKPSDSRNNERIGADHG